MSSALARTWPGRASHIAGVVASGDTLTIRLLAPAPDFLSRIALQAFCAVPSNTPIKERARDPVRRALLRDVLHPRPGGRAGTQPQLPRQASTPLRADRARGRDLHPARVRTKSRPAAPITRIWPRIRRPRSPRAPRGSPPTTGRGSAAAARGSQQYFVNPGLQLDFFDSEHPPDAVQRRTRTPSGQLRDQPARARSARRRLPAGARATDRPLPAAGNARLPRRTRYPIEPNVAKARELVRQAHAGGRTAVLYTCDAYPCPAAGADRQDRPCQDRPPVQINTPSVREAVRARGHTRRAVRSRLGRLDTPTTSTHSRC